MSRSVARTGASRAKPQKEKVLRIVLADDHPIILEGLTQLVNAEVDMIVVGESADGAAAWEAAKSLGPDVLIMDLSMSGLGGVEATQLVRRDCPGTEVIVLTFHEEQAYLSRALEAGAKGYVLKQTASEELLRAIRTVGKGGTYIDPAMTGGLVEDFLAAKDPNAATVPELSDREKDLACCCAGLQHQGDSRPCQP